jgi:hypothetical protein
MKSMTKLAMLTAVAASVFGLANFSARAEDQFYTFKSVISCGSAN